MAPACRSGIDLADLRAKKDYEGMLAKKWRLNTDENALVLRLNVQANFPEQRRAQDRPLIGYMAIRSLPDGSISGLLQKPAIANSFTRASCYSWSSKGHTSIAVSQKKSRAYSTSFNHQRSTKIPSQTQKCMQIKWRDKMARTGKPTFRHEHFRAKYRNVGVFSFRMLFSTTFCWRIFLKLMGID